VKGWVMPASMALHAVAVAALLPWPARRGAAPEIPPVEVELVQQRDATAGAAPSPAEAATASPAGAASADGEGVRRLPGAPGAGQRQAAAAPAVNLGDAEQNREGMDVTGQGVIPPGPDSTWRNQPPAYPIEAARVGAQGIVTLLVSVSAQGLASDVSVFGSSGTASLDRAARNAVRRWHFTPARIEGTPIPFEYKLDIRFILGDRP